MTAAAWLAVLAGFVIGAGLGQVTSAKWPQRRRERALALLATPPLLYFGFTLIGPGWPKNSADWAWVMLGAVLLSPLVLGLWAGVFAEKLFRMARRPAGRASGD